MMPGIADRFRTQSGGGVGNLGIASRFSGLLQDTPVDRPSAPGTPDNFFMPPGQSFGAPAAPTTPSAIRERRYQAAINPPPEEPDYEFEANQRKTEIGKLRSKYLKWADIIDDLDKGGATLEEVQRELAKLLKEEEAAKEASSKANLAEMKKQDEERRLGSRQQGYSNAPSASDVIARQVYAGAEPVGALTGLTQGFEQPTESVAALREMEQDDPTAFALKVKANQRRQAGDEIGAQRTERVLRRYLTNSLDPTDMIEAEAAQKDASMYADMLGTVRGLAGGITLGASDLAFNAAENALNADIDENMTGLGRTGELIGRVGGGLSTAGSLIPKAGRVASKAGIVNPILNRSVAQGSVGLAQGVGNSIAGLQSGQLSKGEAAANIASSVLSSMIAAPIAAYTPGRTMNAAAQVLGDFLVDAAADKTLTDTMDDGFVKWLVERELPNLVVSAAGAGMDLKSARAAGTDIKTTFRRELDAALESYKRTNRVTPTGPTPGVRAQDALEAETVARAQEPIDTLPEPAPIPRPAPAPAPAPTPKPAPAPTPASKTDEGAAWDRVNKAKESNPKWKELDETQKEAWSKIPRKQDGMVDSKSKEYDAWLEANSKLQELQSQSPEYTAWQKIYKETSGKTPPPTAEPPQPTAPVTSPKPVEPAKYSKQERKTYLDTQVAIMKGAGLTNDEMVRYVSNSELDGEVLGSVANRVIKGELTVEQAIAKVKGDVEKMRTGKKDVAIPMEPEGARTKDVVAAELKSELVGLSYKKSREVLKLRAKVAGIKTIDGVKTADLIDAIAKAETKVKGRRPRATTGTGKTPLFDMIKNDGIKARGADYRGGEYDDAPELSELGGFAADIFKKGAKSRPDQLAQQAYDQGLIPEPTASSLWISLRKELNTYRSERKAKGVEGKDWDADRAASEAKSMAEAEERVAVDRIRTANNKSVNEVDLDHGDLVFKDGEWYRTDKTDNTKLVDGKVIELGDFEGVEVRGRLSPGDKGYDIAPQKYKEQEAAKAKPKGTPNEKMQQAGTKTQAGVSRTEGEQQLGRTQGSDAEAEVTRQELENDLRDMPYTARRQELLKKAKLAGVEVPKGASNDTIIERIVAGKKAPEVKPLPGVTKKGGFVGTVKQKPGVQVAPSTDPDVAKVQSAFDKQEKSLARKLMVRYRSTMDSLAQTLWDKKSLSKRKQEMDGLKDVIIRQELSEGWAGEARVQYDEAMSKIDKLITHSNEKSFADYLEARRLLEVAKLQESRGKPYSMPEGATKAQMEKYVAEFERQHTADGTLPTYKAAADIYHKAAREQLDQLRKEGLLTEEGYQALIRDHKNYSLQQMIEKIDPDNVGGTDRSSTGIRELKEGSESGRVPDYRYLLARTVATAQNRIFKNRADIMLVEALTAKGGGGEIDAKIPAKATDPAPHGYEKIVGYRDGERKAVFVPKAFADSWKGGDPLLNATTAEFIRTWSGTKAVKFLATGANPEFAIANLPRDFAYTLINSAEYSPILPKGAAQMLKDYAETAKDAWTGRGKWRDIIREGGALEGPTAEGKLSKDPWNKVTPTSRTAEDVLRWLSKLGEVSERWTRLALYNRALKNGKSKTEAAHAARTILDFGQGGKLTKALDTAVPYLNAVTQATRGIAQGFTRNGAPTQAFKIGQVMALSYFVAGVNEQSNPEVWESISDSEKATKWIFTLPKSFGYKDDQGRTRYRYIAIPKDQGQAVFSAMAQTAMNTIKRKPTDMKQIGVAWGAAFPDLNVNSPLMSMWKAYVDNYDDFRKDEIYKGRKTLPHMELSDSKRWNDTMKWLNEKSAPLDRFQVDISPVRAKRAAEKVVLPHHPLVYLTGKTIEADLPEDVMEMFTKEAIANAPFIRRVLRSTGPVEVSSKVAETAARLGVDIANKPARLARKEVEGVERQLGAERNRMDQEIRDILGRIQKGKATDQEIYNYINSQPAEDQSRLRQRLKTISVEFGMANRFQTSAQSSIPKPSKFKIDF